MNLLPGTGYAELLAGAGGNYRDSFEPFVRAELGLKPLEHVAVFAFTEARREAWQAGVGARVTW